MTSYTVFRQTASDGKQRQIAGCNQFSLSLNAKKTDKKETYNREVDDSLPPPWVANIVGLFLILSVILAVIILVVVWFRG